MLGHPLDQLNPVYTETNFVSPLYLQFPSTPNPALVFDSAIHGYHGELGESAKLRGSGPPATFYCPECRGEQFTISVQFDYDGGCSDLAEDEPGIAIENYFRNVLFQGQCLRCERVWSVLDMDL